MTWEPDDGRYMLVEVLAVVAAVVLGRLSRRYPWLMDFGVGARFLDLVS